MNNHSQHISNDAIASFINIKATIDQYLTKIRAASEDHFFVNPDNVCWGSVGDVARIKSLLFEVIEVLDIEKVQNTQEAK